MYEYDKDNSDIDHDPLTVKQKQALLNIHTKCVKQDYTWQGDHNMFYCKSLGNFNIWFIKKVKTK